MTKEEQAAIAALKRLEKIWPASLWLFADSGNLSVMMKDENGRRATCGAPGGSGMDPDYLVDVIKIETDGGDW